MYGHRVCIAEHREALLRRLLSVGSWAHGLIGSWETLLICLRTAQVLRELGCRRDTP